MSGTSEHLKWDERSRTLLASVSLFDVFLSVRGSTGGKEGEVPARLGELANLLVKAAAA